MLALMSAEESCSYASMSMPIRCNYCSHPHQLTIAQDASKNLFLVRVPAPRNTAVPHLVLTILDQERNVQGSPSIAILAFYRTMAGPKHPLSPASC